MSKAPVQDFARGLRCRHCDNSATVAIRSGFESHPTCDECAAWWPEHRKEPLSKVAADYVYEEDPDA